MYTYDLIQRYKPYIRNICDCKYVGCCIYMYMSIDIHLHVVGLLTFGLVMHKVRSFSKQVNVIH